MSAMVARQSTTAREAIRVRGSDMADIIIPAAVAAEPSLPAKNKGITARWFLRLLPRFVLHDQELPMAALTRSCGEEYCLSWQEEQGLLFTVWALEFVFIETGRERVECIREHGAPRGNPTH